MSEYMFGQELRPFGDIAEPLAQELTAELSRRTTLPLLDPGQRIRATVIGASQFSVQVSGKTIYLPVSVQAMPRTSQLIRRDRSE